MSDQNATPPGWYYAAGDPPGTQRYWDGATWQGGPQPVAQGGVGVGTVGANLATPGKRFLARFVDGLILLIPLGIVTFAFDGGYLASVLTVAISAAYEIYLLGTSGATIGKKVTNIKVVNEDGSDINMETAVRRYAINFVQLIPVLGQILALLIFLATVIMIFSDSQRQVPWDKVAKTLVVNS